MSTPGIPKSKISLSDVRKSTAASVSSTTSLKSISSSGLSSAQKTSVFTRALGSSGRSAGWVGAQRGFNPYDHVSNNVNRYANMRADANRYAGVYSSRNVYVNPQSYDTGMDSAMRAAMGVQLGMQAAKGVFGLLNQFGVFGDNNAKGTGKTDGPGTTPATMTGVTSGSSLPTATTLTGGLSSAGSFSDIKALEDKAEAQKANLDSSYKDLDISSDVQEMLSGEDVKAGLEKAGVTLDTSALALSSLDANDLEASMKTVDSDINNVTNFQTTELPKAKAGVSEQSGIIGQQINATQISIDTATEQKTGLEAQRAQLAATGQDTSAIDQQISQLETQINELTEKKEKLEADKANLDAATKALGEIEKKCGEAIKELQAKKTEIEDMKEFEDEVKDKKYDLAKSQDEQLKKTMDSIDRINKEIDSLKDKNPDKANKSDQKRLAKYNQLIEERNGLYTDLSNLTSALSSAGETEFTNSRNKTYKLQNLDKAMNYGQAPEVVVNPGAGDISGGSGSALDKLDSLMPGETINIGKASYTMQSDGTFKSDQGATFTRDQMSRIANSDLQQGLGLDLT